MKKSFLMILFFCLLGACAKKNEETPVQNVISNSPQALPSSMPATLPTSMPSTQPASMPASLPSGIKSSTTQPAPTSEPATW